MYTRKKRIDEIFGEKMSLKSWVSCSQSSIENKITELVDSNLVISDDNNFTAKTQCVLSILEDWNWKWSVINFPMERIDMREVVARLEKIKNDVSKNKRC